MGNGQQRLEFAVPFRLACTDCDIEPDFVNEAKATQAGWKDVHYVDDPQLDEVGVWWSHLGSCPECVTEGD